MATELEHRFRAAAMAWLGDQVQRGDGVVTSDSLSTFRFDGQRVALIDRQRGIRKPAMLSAALSLRTSFTPPGRPPPYDDAPGPDGLLRYKYRGDDPRHAENVALRNAMEQALPLIWFVAVAPSVYQAIYPVWLVADEPEQLQFAVAVDEAQRFVPVGADLSSDQRRYVERLTKLRLHQPVFRARVLTAYETTCAVCRLKHGGLLDAAHILPDTHPRGLPIVPNGLSLCKIHHAAFDQGILGIRPDLVVEIRRDILDEVDGPMLRHGLQEMAGVALIVPRRRESQPDRQALEERYETFRRPA